MAYISYYPEQSRYEKMYQSGTRFFSLSITLGDGFYGAYRNGKVRLDKKGVWDAPGTIDYTLIDRSIREITDVAPDALIFPRIYCDAPSWWCSMHPADTNRSFSGLPQRQSFSSMIWREETVAVLKSIVRHFRQSAYSSRIAGIHVTAGETEESVHHQWLGPSDYSLVSQKRFREWLFNTCQQDESRIRERFGKNLDEIDIPAPEEREKAGIGDFYDPEINQLSIDYQLFRCDEIAGALETFCKSVKEESNGSLFTGVFYGYTLVEWRDHLALSRMLKSPFIDFFSCTNGAGKNTRLGEHDMHFLTETDSIQKAGKLFFYEADTRTSNSRWISEMKPDVDPYHEYDLPNWLGPETIEKSLELLKAVFSRVICTGSVHWWFDLWGGWYDDRRILEQFGEMQKIGNESLHLPRGSVAEVCVFVSEKSLACYATATRKFTWISRQMQQIGRIGAPYDIFLSDDLSELDVSRYKMFIFLNAFQISSEEKKAIREKCMSGDRTLFWLYAPGVAGMKGSETIQDSYTNMELSVREGTGDRDARVLTGSRELVYKGARVNPFVSIKGGASRIYGWDNDKNAILGERNDEGCTQVLATLPPVPWEIIQYFAVQSGVHIYCPGGEVVYANQGYLAVSAKNPGKRMIHLRAKKGLSELLAGGERYAPAVDHEISFKEETCKLFKML